MLKEGDKLKICGMVVEVIFEETPYPCEGCCFRKNMPTFCSAPNSILMICKSHGFMLLKEIKDQE